jgi:DNA polymerase I-like protein with 3'-5' exonuclease and polymerase domains
MSHLLINMDKAGAEFVMVAYLSGDTNMLQAVASGDTHSRTAHLMTGAPIALIQRERKLIGELSDPNRIEELRRLHMPEIFDLKFVPRTMSLRQAGKKAGLGANYGLQYRTFSLKNEIEEKEGKQMLYLYHLGYPGIEGDYHREVREELHANGRTLWDLLGNRCYFMENWGEELFRQGYAFKPQSTVGRMVNRALSLAMDDEADFMQPMEILSQVHDSIVLQYPLDWTGMARMCIRMNAHMSPSMTYKGRTFALATDLKVGLNRAHMLDVPLGEDADALAAALENAYSKLTSRKAAA